MNGGHFEEIREYIAYKKVLCNGKFTIGKIVMVFLQIRKIVINDVHPKKPFIFTFLI
jgi:hypothetical protein